jgi:hypothetical protein
MQRGVRRSQIAKTLAVIDARHAADPGKLSHWTMVRSPNRPKKWGKKARLLPGIYHLLPPDDSVELEEKWIEKERRYTCRLAAFKGPRPLTLIESVQTHDTGGEIDNLKGLAPSSDYGLCLAKGLYVQIDGGFYQVEKVDPEQGLVRIKHEENDRNKRFRYFFDRTTLAL